ncbi:general stress protein [Thalassospira sp. MA62]|nr:general stress protein [Thalassospira sp. MA62]
MAEEQDTKQVPELVGLFETKESFDAAVRELRDAGFARTDLSVLSSHESIDVAGSDGRSWSDVFTALVGETKYEVPLVASGAIALFGGAATAAVALAVGAGVGAVALSEFLDEVTSTPHTEDFARAVDAGSVIVWVRIDPDKDGAEATARGILEKHGATNIHLHMPKDDD